MNPLPLLVVVPLWGSFLLPFVGPLGRAVRNTVFLFFSTLTLLLVFFLCRSVGGGALVHVFGGPVAASLKGPALAVFELDAFGAAALLGVSLLAFSGALFSVWDTERFSGRSRYMALFLLTTAGLLGMCAAGDLFTFFVALETSVVALAGLIAFWRDKPSSVEAAFKFLVVSQVAACLLMLSIGLLHARYGTTNIASLAFSMKAGTAEKTALALLVCPLLFFLGAFFVPAHTWFPEACSPTPGGVGCLLLAFCHASFYALIRVCCTLFPNAGAGYPLSWILIGAGCLSMCLGALMALDEHRLKRLVGYVVVSQLGVMLLAFGVGLWALQGTVPDLRAVYETAFRGGLLQLLLGAPSGGLLVLCSGAIYYATGTRDLDRMGGLLRHLPFCAGTFLFAWLVVVGLPPLGGFASKWMILQSCFAVHPVFSALGIFATFLLMAVFLKVFYGLFLGPPRSRLATVQEAPYGMWGAMAFLMLAVLLLSFFSGWVRGSLDDALQALLRRGAYIDAMNRGI